MPIVLEHDVGLFELAFPLDVHLVVPIDENVGDRGIAKQHFERTQAEQLVDHVRDERLALEQAQRHRRAFALDHPGDQAPDLGLGLVALHPRQPIEVESVQQFLMNTALEVLVIDAARVDVAAANRQSRCK